MVTILPRLLSLSQGLNVTKTIRTLLALLSLSSLNLYATDTLRFIGDINFATGEKFQDTEVGGLSGIVYDKEQNKILAISDDKGYLDEARLYEFDLSLTEKSFSVKPSNVIKLKTKEGTFFPKGYADFEGITLHGKDIIVSSEASLNRGAYIPSELYRFSRDGSFLELLPVPAKFLMPNSKEKNKENLYGSRDNKAFEALSTSLDGKTTYLGSEEALYQDGEISNTTYGSPVRIVLYQDLKPFKEVVYELEKVEVEKDSTTPGENGLVDIAAIDDQNFYSLERSYLPMAHRNVIRIFKCTISNKTTDVLKVESLKDASFTSIEKTLVADLEDFVIKMNPHSLDNIEGLAFGPSLPNGKRSLIVVSDNNFGKAQRTLFMAFEITTP